jgi:hypothetical protein
MTHVSPEAWTALVFAVASLISSLGLYIRSRSNRAMIKDAQSTAAVASSTALEAKDKAVAAHEAMVRIVSDREPKS